MLHSTLVTPCSKGDTRACDMPGATILAPEPGFVMYAMSARLQGLQFVGVPLAANFALDEAAM